MISKVSIFHILWALAALHQVALGQIKWPWWKAVWASEQAQGC